MNEIELNKLVNRNLSRIEICETLNINLSKLKRMLKKFNITIRKYKLNFSKKCRHCDNVVEYKSFDEKEFVYCSYACSNKRSHSNETKMKIRDSLIANGYKKNKRCLNCKCDIGYLRSKNKFCSRSCSSKHFMNTEKGKIHNINMVSKSIVSQSKRSKNEILFYDKCLLNFNNVEHNKPIFNGWDADIIIHDLKIAVMWNGICHYKQIYKTQTLKQIENRDRIKQIEIKKYGYEPYIIKDMGKHSKKKVEEEFDLFLLYIKERHNY